jgi:colanic acid biosynthesis glycosyl transferase WcaI
MVTGKPRVTVVGLNYAPEASGIAPYTAGLASGLAGLGWDVRAVTSFPHYPAWRIAEGFVGRSSREVLDKVKVTRLRPYMPKNPAGFKRLIVELHFGFRSVTAKWGRPEVIVLVSPALFSVALALAKAKLSPQRPSVIIWVQDLYSLGVAETGAMGGNGARIMGVIESQVLKRADVVVAIHDRFKRYITSALKVTASDIAVVRNWTHLRVARPEKSGFRESLRWGEETVVLHAGNMGAKQALENVVEAARLADIQRAPVRFVLLGDGNQREKLELLGAGIERLEFLSPVSDDEFQGAMAAADILLVNEKPGIAEMAVPSKLTSYFAAGRPVIAATDTNSITAEEVETAQAGVRVDAGDPQALLDEALALGRDVERAAVLAANGINYQLRLLSRDAAIAHYAEIINSLAGSRGR